MFADGALVETDSGQATPALNLWLGMEKEKVDGVYNSIKIVPISFSDHTPVLED